MKEYQRSHYWLLPVIMTLAPSMFACDSTAKQKPATQSSAPNAGNTPINTETDKSDAAESTDENVLVVPGEFVVPARRDAAALPAGLIAVSDLNGDGSNDFVACLEMKPADTSTRRRIVAYSGADHSVLWGTDAPLVPPTKSDEAENDAPKPSIDIDGLRALPDMNADGVDDIFVTRRGEESGFAVVSGSDGAIMGINAVPKDEIDHLVDARDFDGDGRPDLVFAVRIRDDAPNQPADRLCFAVYSGVHFKRVVSFGKPFNRLGVRQSLLFGGFPDTNADGIAEILCFGESAPIRDRPQEGHFAMIDGQRLKRWVLTQSPFDPTTRSSFIAVPGIIAPDSFADLIISTATSADSPSQLGLYVLKQKEFAWTLSGDAAATAIGKRLEMQPNADAGFGAPIIPIPDQDGDGLNDVATICNAPDASDNGVLTIVSSKSGRILRVECATGTYRIESNRHKVQLVLVRSNDSSRPDRIAITGYRGENTQRKPALFYFDLKIPSASTPSPS